MEKSSCIKFKMPTIWREEQCIMKGKGMNIKNLSPSTDSVCRTSDSSNHRILYQKELKNLVRDFVQRPH